MNKFIIAFILIISASNLLGQYQIDKSVTKSGGTQSNSNHKLHSVIGQAIGNQSSNTFYNLKEGFIFSFESFVALLDEPISHSITFSVDSVIDAGSIRFNVQRAKQITNAMGYFILARANADPNIILTDGIYSTLHSISNNTKIVAISTDINADTVVATGLQPNKTYTFYLIPYNWDGNHNASINYKTDGTIPKVIQSTPIPTMSEWALIILGLSIPVIVYFKMK